MGEYGGKILSLKDFNLTFGRQYLMTVKEWLCRIQAVTLTMCLK
jgi:hypothetical protein